MRRIDWFIIGLVGLVIVFMIFTVAFMKSEAKECLANPINYFEAKTDGSCSCRDAEGKLFANIGSGVESFLK